MKKVDLAHLAEGLTITLANPNRFFFSSGCLFDLIRALGVYPQCLSDMSLIPLHLFECDKLVLMFNFLSWSLLTSCNSDITVIN